MWEELGYQGASAPFDLAGEVTVLRRVGVLEASAEDCNRPAARSKRSGVGCGVDASRKAGDHGKARVDQLSGEFAGTPEAIKRSSAGADDRN